jgi:hypothetical protein
MKSNDRPQSKERSDYSSLFIGAILLITVAVATEGLATPVRQFIQGVLVGMSIACSVIGFAIYARAHKK